MVNNANYNVCPIVYTLIMSKQTFRSSYFAQQAPKARRNKHYNVDSKHTRTTLITYNEMTLAA